MSWERETIINFCEGEDEADVYTYNERWINRLEKVLKLTPYAVNADGGKSYKLSKKLLKLPTAKRNISDEQRQRASERFKNMHQNRSMKHEV